MPQLSRSRAPHLLHQVEGKSHASSDDHEEEHNASAVKEEAGKTDEDIYAEPISSDEEVLPSLLPPPSAQYSNSIRPRVENNLFTAPTTKQQGARHRQRNTPIRTPLSGLYNKGNGKLERGEEKENSSAVSGDPVGKRKSYNNDKSDDEPFGMGQGVTSKKRFANSYTTTAKRKTFGSRPLLSSAGQKQSPMSRPTGKATTASSNPRAKSKCQSSIANSDDSESDVSMHSLAEIRVQDTKKKTLSRYLASSSDDEDLEVAELRVGRSKDAKCSKNQPSSPKQRVTLADLDAYKSLPPPLQSSNTSASQLGALSHLDTLDSGNSTPLSSIDSADIPENGHRETVGDLEKYLEELPSNKDDDDKCPLCDERVERELYWEFWKGKKRLLRAQEMFCKLHKHRKALAEYKERGYPSIDWDDLPQQITQVHSHLLAVLKKETPSVHRDTLAHNIAAGTHHTRVKDFIENEDDNAVPEFTTAGYYGVRGARAMMEIIVAELAGAIRERAQDDKVVAGTSVANFVQKVLVPECTVQLVMRDLDVSESMAKQVIEESGVLGALVNEEVEDSVAVRDEEVEDSFAIREEELGE
ncbi:hypothetical protein EJ04DRAFT_476567 [Polyplosphaeria fusca]|uniref:Restriction of telomere capping protein 4 n=1 Tax=Polyplosphaeria fusca TaxID=682080 RepID=A0A9P4QQA2_9PLEO|nr:hypothetical protein EJ04DRAFT_476567 [Polyplosphaeria fusca]